MKRRVIMFFTMLLVFTLLLMAIQVFRFGSLTGYVVYNSSFQNTESGGVSIEEAYNASLSDIPKISVVPGANRVIPLTVTNTGPTLLSKCSVRDATGSRDWIISNEVKDIPSGESAQYNPVLGVPLIAVAGDYLTNLAFECFGFRTLRAFSITVFADDFEVDLGSYKKVGNKFRVNYHLVEFGGENQEINVKYRLLNLQGAEETKGEQEVILAALSSADYVLEFELPNGVVGDYILEMDYTNGRITISKKQELYFSNEGLTGLVVSETNKQTLSWFGAAIVFVLAVFYISRFIYSRRTLRKVSKQIDDRGFIKIDLNK